MKSQQWTTSCGQCGDVTSRKYAREHDGKCKACVTGIPKAVKSSGESQDRYHDYIASGAYAAGVSFSDS